MKPPSLLGLNFQRVFDLPLVALAMGCAYFGYQQIQKEDSPEKRGGLHQGQFGAAEVERHLEQLKHLSSECDANIELLKEKRQKMQLVLENAQSFSSRLEYHHKKLDMEIEDLRGHVEAGEKLQAGSLAPHEFDSESKASGRS